MQINQISSKLSKTQNAYPVTVNTLHPWITILMKRDVNDMKHS